MNIRFACCVCEHPGRLDVPGPREWQCPRCDHWVRLTSGTGEGPLQTCCVCGNGELYKKKDFPHWLGLTILAAACVAFFVLNGLYHQWWAWGVLLGSALFDGLLYVCVKDAVVCYRCGAHYRGFPSISEHKPFDLLIAERYRQEKIRREQLQAAKKT